MCHQTDKTKKLVEKLKIKHLCEASFARLDSIDIKHVVVGIVVFVCKATVAASKCCCLCNII